METATNDAPALSEDLLHKLDAYWRAANYLSVGQIFLRENPLLRERLQPAHIKPRLLGHWGTGPGLSLIYVHLNRLIKAHALNVMYICGPGHGAPAILANVYLEGTYSEVYPRVSADETGMRRLFKQFSYPGGVPSHTAANVPGSIHEGGELGYSLSHAFGAAFDNPELIVACVIGDGEAETGPLANAWHGNKFLNPRRDGAVLPILHLNDYKIANPTLYGRTDDADLAQHFRGLGYQPHFVVGDEPMAVHRALAEAMDAMLAEIQGIQQRYRDGESAPHEVPRWPMLVLRTPKGWTGPEEVDGKPVEGFWRSHQVPLKEVRERPEQVEQLEKWLKRYRPEELFDERGTLIPELRELAPEGQFRMSANPHTNGGSVRQPLEVPNFRDYAVTFAQPATEFAQAAKVCGSFLRDVMKHNDKTFRIVCPDELASNRLSALFEVTERAWMAGAEPRDQDLGPEGRVLEMLSEHTCQGWLEGYLLTGRHGVFACYEAFIHIVDSMFNQHAKWLKVVQDEISWREPISSFNYLLTSHCWRQDHNGFSHQDPGFIDHVVNKKGDVIRVYLPPDANTLLSVMDHCLRSQNYVNVIVAGKQPELQYLEMDAAAKHCNAGLGIWEWASNDRGEEPDVVMAAAGDVPTLEALAATAILREKLPELKVRFVNVVDLMRLMAEYHHPHGLSDYEFDAIFTKDKPIIFAYHGYPWLIHRLTYKRTNHANLHVRGYIEEGTTTTPFDMVVLNQLDRFHLVRDVIERVPGLATRAAYVDQEMKAKLIEHHDYIREHGIDMPEIRNWTWPAE